MKRSFIQLHIAIFLAGFTGVLGRLITLNEGLLVWYRLFFSAVIIWILLSFSKKGEKVATSDILKMVLIGFVMAVHWVAFFGSIKYANVSVALVCFSAVGFFTAIFEPLVMNHKFSLADILLGLLVIAGIALIFHFDPKYKTGIIIGVSAAMLGSIFPIYNRKLIQRMNARTLMTYELTGGWLMLTLLMPFYLAKFTPDKYFPGLDDLFWLLILAVACTVWAFMLSSNALKNISAFTVNLSYNFEPVYGIILAFIIFHENKYLGYGFYYGISLIFLAVIIQSWRMYRMR